MEFYTIFYDYLDKRGHRRTKKLICCGSDRLKEKCQGIMNLKDHKPVSKPLIYITKGVDEYIDTVDFDNIIKGGKLN